MIFKEDFLSGKVALVTGGGTGIGEVISQQLAAHGADVAVISRNADHHHSIVEKVRGEGRRALALTADVRDEGQVNSAVEAVLNGLGRIDILVNNAAGNFLCPVEDMSLNAWKTVLDIVLNGTFIVSKAALPALKQSGHGNIVNIGATYAWSAAPLVAHSGAAKAGVLNLTRSLAAEWGRYGVRVNAVTPGPIEETEGVRRLMGDEKVRERIIRKTPLARLGRREEIAWAILFLVSPAAEYVTGANLVVDGGLWFGTTPF